MPRRTYVISAVMLVLAVIAAIQIYITDRNAFDVESNNNAVLQAAQVEAAALDRVATAEVQAARTEFDAGVIKTQNELLRYWLPRTTTCTSTPAIAAVPDNPDTSDVDESRPAVPGTETCTTAAPTSNAVATAVAGLSPGGSVSNQILPVDRLLPDEGGASGQFLLSVPGTTLGAWGPNVAGLEQHDVIQWNGSQIVWGPAIATSASGAITAVNAGTGLTGGGTHGAVTLNIELPFTQAEKDKLAGIQADIHLPAVASEAEAVAGTLADARLWTPQRDRQGFDAFWTAYWNGSATNSIITTAKLADDAVTHAKVADDAIGGNELRADSVSTGHIANAAITEAKIATNAVTTAKIMANAVTSSQLAANAVTPAVIEADAITPPAIADDAVTAAAIADDAITAPAIADGTIIEDKLSSGVRTKLNATGSGGPIADNSIAPTKAQANTAAEKVAWRERLESSHIDAGDTLPPIASTIEGDVMIIDVLSVSGLVFRDLSALNTELNTAAIGDVMMVLDISRLGKTWVRLGNLLSGSAALRDRIATNETGLATINSLLTSLSPYADMSIEPRGLPDATIPDIITITLGNRLKDGSHKSTITRILVQVNGTAVHTVTADANTTHIIRAEISTAEKTNIVGNLGAKTEIAIALQFTLEGVTGQLEKRAYMPIRDSRFISNTPIVHDAAGSPACAAVPGARDLSSCVWNLSITPRRTSSTFIVTAHGHIDELDTNRTSSWTLVRTGSNPVVSDGQIYRGAGQNPDRDTHLTAHLLLVDKPSTTSSITYQLTYGRFTGTNPTSVTGAKLFAVEY